MENWKDLTEHCFLNLKIKDDELCLLRSYLNPSIMPEELRALYDSFDIEKIGSQQVCILAEISDRLAYKGVPEKIVQRMRGVADSKLFVGLGEN